MRRFVTLMCLFSTSTLLITLASASSQPPPFCEAGALDILQVRRKLRGLVP
jgi:hypothetical protein